MATAPNTPGDILRDLAFRSYSPQAGDHPNFPEEALAAAVSDPTRAHLVVGNAKLTDEQLRAALRAVDPFTDDDDDEIWAVLTAAGAAKHPNASEETVKSALLTSGRGEGVEAPGDEEHSEPVVVVVGEAARDAAGEFDESVHGLGAAVG